MGKKLRALGVGALIGAGLGILFAPKKGSETREDIKNKVKEIKADLEDIDYDDVKDYFETKKVEIETALKDLDKEKVKNIAIKKAKDVEKEAKKLYNYVKSKSEPVLIDAAEVLKKQTVKAAKAIVEKYE